MLKEILKIQLLKIKLTINSNKKEAQVALDHFLKENLKNKKIIMKKNKLKKLKMNKEPVKPMMTIKLKINKLL